MLTKKKIPAAWLSALVALASLPALAQKPAETILHSFRNFPHGSSPYGTLARDAQGNLYGTTYLGGARGQGTVFVLDAAGQYKILYSFQGQADGSIPSAGVTLDSAGNLYGTAGGGTSNAGVVYKLDRSGQQTVLYTFTGGADGSGPTASVTFDTAGNLYGTTVFGGAANSGVVYKLDSAGNETVLHSFGVSGDGLYPYAGVTLGPDGNLFGTTATGGKYSGGIIYALNPSGQETVLHNFNSTTGANPYAGLIRDPAGNFYGTAQGGGSGSGVIYKLDTAGNYTVLHYFSEATGGLAHPDAGLVPDAAGNLYGTTQGGGAAGLGGAYKLDTAGNLQVLYSFPANASLIPRTDSPGPGVVVDPSGNIYGVVELGTGATEGGLIYKVDTSGVVTTLYGFAPAPGGTSPFAGVVLDPAGNLYGTTSSNDTSSNIPNWGLVYMVDASGNERVLYKFTGHSNGAYPQGGVIRDPAGNLYGTTWSGGTANKGVVFKVNPAGQEAVLHSFTGGADGGAPVAGLIRDANGNLYGTTPNGGTAGSGVVFKMDASGNETVLYSFKGETDGGSPYAGLIGDAEGNLYGTTVNGGASGCGVVFKLDASGNESVLYSFAGWPDGCSPQAGVVRDADGNLYGTAFFEAGRGCDGNGCGMVYRVDPSGNETVLYRFMGSVDGGNPMAGVIRDPAGNLYGTTVGGGVSGCGVVYRIDPAGQETVLHSFAGSLTDGCRPWAGVAADSAGNLYGTAPYDGAGDGGILFKITLQ